MLTQADAVNQNAENVVFALDPQRPEWLSNGFSENEALAWRRSGFTPADATRWKSFSFPGPEDAEPWYSISVPLPIAKMLLVHNVTPQQASLWFPNNDIGPDVRLTRKQSLCLISWVRAQVQHDAWVHSCIINEISHEDWLNISAGTGMRPSPEEIACEVSYQWSVNGFSEAVENAYRSEGITNAFQARLWVTHFADVGVPIRPKAAALWQQKDFFPDEAAGWVRAINLSFPNSGNTVSLAAKWRDSLFVPFDMYLLSKSHRYAWIPPDITSSEIQAVMKDARTSGAEKVFLRMFELGIPEPHTWEVEELRIVEDGVDTGTYLTVEEISLWVGHNFASQDSVLFWKSQGFSPVDAALEVAKLTS